MKRAAGITASAFGVLLLAACSGPGGGPRGGMGPPLRPIAEPSRVVATEMSFARAAQEKGQWTAFAEFAAPEAVMFVPAPVKAKDWLKTQVNPRQAVRWQPHRVWSSCDGSLAVSKGAWQRPDGTQGYFTTIWQRQPDASYKWVLDQGDVLETPLEEPDMVGADIADCPKRSPGMPRAPAVAPIAADGLSGTSNDGSLSWKMEVAADRSRVLHVSLARGEGADEVLTSAVAAPVQ